MRSEMFLQDTLSQVWKSRCACQFYGGKPWAILKTRHCLRDTIHVKHYDPFLCSYCIAVVTIAGPGPNMGGPLQSMQPPAYNQNQNGIPTLSHPPRPPLVGFMPPQVRHQPPSTQANVRPLIHPPMPFIGAGPMQRPMAMPNTMAGPKPSQETLTGAPVRYTQPAVVMAPRVVYSSKPVLNKPTKQNHKPTEAAAGPVETRKREAEPAPSTSQPMAEEAKPDTQQSKKKKKKLDTRTLRTAAGEVWEDANLAEWDAGMITTCKDFTKIVNCFPFAHV